ncbi:NAD(P)H-dependent oxidoreductase [Alkaliphilus pronyensis]|uniref:NAD(P)H-dependent oxidoreductase n=1 Tax=Alkaliphilus pronyensis TaxID=1482732 RepID=A0A6I0F8E2_9FIRM|nr:NAD(P)H-dependent oxidoreductase [Alkaliphilus pronyensis]KAB3531262.1 NAD(P)H-dependent oxidoreductase [Alkaliphilus pronyensis]
MIYVIKPGIISSQLEAMVEAAIGKSEYFLIENKHQLCNLKNKKILFAIEVNSIGISIPLLEILSYLSVKNHMPLQGSSAVMLVHSNNQLYTKSMAAHIAFIVNQMGCSFIGQPLVEATGDLSNFTTWQKVMDLSLVDISLELSSQLGERLRNEVVRKTQTPKILALHSSFRATSNTLSLWGMIKEHIHDCSIDELHIENGSVYDCYGCSYKTCLSFGEQNSCYYGGVMTKSVLPAIEESDAIVWICPNYNDSISSNLMAVINRLTTLYRRISFNNKMVFSVIVSGNSGSDSIAKQLIDALNFNKGFYLPPNFSIMEIANDLGAIWRVENIEEKAKAFAEHMLTQIK